MPVVKPLWLHNGWREVGLMGVSTRKRAIWDGAAFALLDHERFAVGYKHHLDHIETNPGEITVFYNYRARTRDLDPDGNAGEWGTEFADAVRKTGQMIIAEPEWKAGRLVSVGFMDCGGEKLTIEIVRAPVELISIAPSGEAYRWWQPEGYADPEHIFNHRDLRT
jgi:hypothetical protein